MTGKIPTQSGDVLILRTDRAAATHAVLAISKSGQQEFRHYWELQYVSGPLAAQTLAKSLVGSNGKIYLRNDDTGHWVELKTLLPATIVSHGTKRPSGI
jgi:hypothetical protein